MDRFDRFFATMGQPGLGVALLAVALLGVALLVAFWRGGRARSFEAAARTQRQRELDDKLAGLMQMNAELAGRMRAMTETAAARQGDLARAVNERLDAVGSRVGQGIEQSARSTAEHLGKLGERLAVIDRAQGALADLSREMIGLKDILANKQARGAFGQGRMEAIVRDGLPAAAYAFQHTLSNRTRPDCVIRLPGDARWMVIDAKFPLEAFLALRAARAADERKQASTRVRGDVAKHLRDIAERYFIAGETQDIAMLFVPSESIYADLQEHFDDIVQKAHRARVLIVSPSLLMLAIQVMQSVVRDARMREQAHVIQDQARALLDDVGRLRDRGARLATHFRQAQEDLDGVLTSSDKIVKRGERMAQLDLAEPETDSAAAVSSPQPQIAGASG